MKECGTDKYIQKLVSKKKQHLAERKKYMSVKYVLAGGEYGVEIDKEDIRKFIDEGKISGSSDEASRSLWFHEQSKMYMLRFNSVDDLIDAFVYYYEKSGETEEQKEFVYNKAIEIIEELKNRTDTPSDIILYSTIGGDDIYTNMLGDRIFMLVIDYLWLCIIRGEKEVIDCTKHQIVYKPGEAYQYLFEIEAFDEDLIEHYYKSCNDDNMQEFMSIAMGNIFDKLKNEIEASNK